MRRDRKHPQRFVSKTRQPELAWTLEIGEPADGVLAGNALDESITWYDVEIYDRDRLVAADEAVPEPRYTVPVPLECGEYRWSVRPSWRIGETVRYGDWMRFPARAPESDGEDEGEQTPAPNGLSGRAASEAPAYTQDFPALTIACGRR